MRSSPPIEDPSECWYIYVGEGVGNRCYIGFPACRNATSILNWIAEDNLIRSGYGTSNDVFWTMVF